MDLDGWMILIVGLAIAAELWTLRQTLVTIERGNRVRHRQLLRQIHDPSDGSVIEDIYEGDMPL